MKLGKLFKAVVKLPLLPAAVAADVLTLGVSKVAPGEQKLLTEKAVDSIADDLDEVTE